MPFLRLYIENTQMLTQYPNIYHVYILTRYTKHILTGFIASAHNLIHHVFHHGTARVSICEEQSSWEQFFSEVKFPKKDAAAYAKIFV